MVVIFHTYYIAALDGKVTLGCGHLTPPPNQQGSGEKKSPVPVQAPHNDAALVGLSTLPV
jgi:hypothetical protein